MDASTNLSKAENEFVVMRKRIEELRALTQFKRAELKAWSDGATDERIVRRRSWRCAEPGARRHDML